MKCGFIGLGSQGGPMAQRIIDAGYDVVLWARRQETLEPYAGSSATFASSVSELGKQVRLCAVCVVDDDGVEQICQELIPAMAAGSYILIHSTVRPDLCRSLAQQAATRNLFLIDAPVSGGGGSAEEGTLTVMLGGDETAINAVRPVLDTFAGTIVHLGDVGSGQVAKIVNNSLMAANLAVAHYAFEAARELQLDVQAFADLVKVSSGRSFGVEVRARMPEPAAFSHGAKLLAKDVRLLGDLMGADNPRYSYVREVAGPFLDLALASG